MLDRIVGIWVCVQGNVCVREAEYMRKLVSMELLVSILRGLFRGSCVRQGREGSCLENSLCA